jgi:hypothetical protein
MDVAQWKLTGGGWAPLGANPTYVEGTAGSSYDAVTSLGAVPGFSHAYLVIGGGFTRITGPTTYEPSNGAALFDLSYGPYTSRLAGYYYFSYDDGTINGGVGGVVFSIFVDGSTVYLGGQFTSAGGHPAQNFSAYNLSATTRPYWSIPGQTTGAPVYTITKAGTNLYLGGLFTGVNGVATNGIAEYTPGAANPWAGLGHGLSMGGGYVSSLAQSADGLYAGGDFGLAGTTTPSANLALWTATAGM